ncbi:MAG: 4-demethylwyosine synthase TYW1 [Nanoarchaeota archaeon]|nr:4-demethylwyosine synthase TYW1 [Nanoarchaeota archaeon]
MLTKKRKEDLYKQGYRVVGNHSAVKVCMWTKKAIKKEDVCYKKTFYGINSHMCVQMTPALPFCGHRCTWCWRDIAFTKPKWQGKVDSPKKIVDGCIQDQITFLKGFGGNPKTNKTRYQEAHLPIHFAISLSGEPTLYPKLPQLIDELKKRKISSFLVTNGTNPSMLKKLLKHQPTQLYLTLPSPDEQAYEKYCNPLIKNGWKKINQSLNLLKRFKRSVARLTLVKDQNMIKPELYAELIKKYKPLFVEAKAYMWVGHSRERMTIKNMPLHEEIKEFSKKICKTSGYKIIDEKKESRVILLMEKDSKERIMKF